MKNYQQSLSIKASPAAVYAALTTIEGLRAWWTQDCEGGVAVGDTLEFRFSACYKDMRIEELQPDNKVRWLCTRAHIVAESISRADEWVDTHIVFSISDAGLGETLLDLEHIGLLPSLQCFTLCQNGWQHFLASLQQFLETGTGTPFALAKQQQTPSTERRTAA
ncbi:SRPBCC family protein [Undibacterium sp. Ji83W]|uniref:SRPBCC family protein n=1 Tax=Undibacterium sp. Ji83W TaxID=3413043 RepID=UPI003BF34B5F